MIVFDASWAALCAHAERAFNGHIREAADASALALQKMSERIMKLTPMMLDSIAIAEHSLIALMQQAGTAWATMVSAVSSAMPYPIVLQPYDTASFRYRPGTKDYTSGTNHLPEVDVYYTESRRLT